MLEVLYNFVNYPELNHCEYDDLSVVDKIILDTREIDLSLYPNLTVISRVGVGVDNIDIDECKRRNIPVYITPCRELSNAVANFTVMQMLNLLSYDNPRESIDTKNVLIVGCGRIGSAVFDRLRAFCDCDSIDLPYYPNIEDYNRYKNKLANMIGKFDIVTVHASGNKEILNSDLIRNMKKGSYLLNMARKECIDFEAAVGCLSDGNLSGVASDVNSLKDLSKSTWDTFYHCCIDKLLLTDHIASNTIEARKEMERLALDNLNFIDNQSTMGYRVV